MRKPPKGSLAHGLDPIHGFERKHTDLQVRGEQQEVEELSHSRACEAELSRKCGAIRNQALVDQSLQVMRKSEHAGDLRGTPYRGSVFKGDGWGVTEFDTSPLSTKQRALQDDAV